VKLTPEAFFGETSEKLLAIESRPRSEDWRSGPLHQSRPDDHFLFLAWQTCSQFYQNFTSSIYGRTSQKRKKIRTTWLNFYAIGICARKMLMKLTAVVNFNNILQAAFLYKSVLRSFTPHIVWICRKNVGTKSACKMLGKFAIVVNLNNILRASFLTILPMKYNNRNPQMRVTKL